MAKAFFLRTIALGRSNRASPTHFATALATSLVAMLPASLQRGSSTRPVGVHRAGIETRRMTVVAWMEIVELAAGRQLLFEQDGTAERDPRAVPRMEEEGHDRREFADPCELGKTKEVHGSFGEGEQGLGPDTLAGQHLDLSMHGTLGEAIHRIGRPLARIALLLDQIIPEAPAPGANDDGAPASGAA